MIRDQNSRTDLVDSDTGGSPCSIASTSIVRHIQDTADFPQEGVTGIGLLDEMDPLARHEGGVDGIRTITGTENDREPGATGTHMVVELAPPPPRASRHR